jgi:hypothetical protein
MWPVVSDDDDDDDDDDEDDCVQQLLRGRIVAKPHRSEIRLGRTTGIATEAK